MLHVKTAALVELGRLADAEAAAVESHRLALDVGDASARGYGSAVLAWTYTVMGRLDARPPLRRRGERAVPGDAGRRGPPVGARHPAVRAEPGRSPGRRRRRASPPSTPSSPTTAGCTSRSSSSVGPGSSSPPARRSAALARLDAAADGLHGVAASTPGRCSCSTNGPASALLTSAATLAAAACCQSSFHTAMADHVVAIERRDATALADVADRFAGFGAELVAAEAAASARDAFARGGDQQAASRWAARSRDLAQRCEGAATAGLDVGQPDRAADASRAGGGHAGPGRQQQPRRRRRAAPLGAHGREPPRPGVRQVGHQQPVPSSPRRCRHDA